MRPIDPPIGFEQAARAFADPTLLLAGIGVGICSSAVPYVSDQLATSRLPRASFALMLALLPATATVVGAILLDQVPTTRDLTGVLLVIVGVGMHRPLARSARAGTARAEGPRRFSDLRRDIPGISEKVLSQHLRGLEADGIVARREFHEGAVLATEYGFTEYGRTLIPALNALAQWGMKHQASRAQARPFSDVIRNSMLTRALSAQSAVALVPRMSARALHRETVI